MKIKNYAELLSEVLKMDKSLGPNGSQCFNLSKKMDAQQAINILKRSFISKLFFFKP